MIAIAANPASGRDIRRLVARASVFDNTEKAKIVERIVLAAYRLHPDRIVIMPDNYYFGERVTETLERRLKLLPPGTIELPALRMDGSAQDTARFAAWAEENGADVLITLGGDGTNRAAAKGLKDLPLIAVSTGTNNVFPQMLEGTSVGMAAAAISAGIVNISDAAGRCKRIEIFRNGAPADIALIDAVFTDQIQIGARAVWKKDNIRRIAVTQAHPASIGFSSLVGSRLPVFPEEDFGAVCEVADGEPNTVAALSAGILEAFCLKDLRKIPLDEEQTFSAETPGTLALDGERELTFRAGDRIGLRVTRSGPRRVDVRRVLEQAQTAGFFVIRES